MGEPTPAPKRESDRIRHGPRKCSGSLLKAVALFSPGSAVIAWTIQKSNGCFSTQPRDTKYSGYRVKCGKCGVVKLTLAEFRQQVTDKPEQVWRCPKCGSIAAFKE
jgi:DNA-directed RNA polymerase subunit M/transcription elongation factor TFIIS